MVFLKEWLYEGDSCLGHSRSSALFSCVSEGPVGVRGGQGCLDAQRGFSVSGQLEVMAPLTYSIHFNTAMG